VETSERLSRLQAALTLLESGQAGRAESVCDELLGHDAEDIEVLLLRGLAIGARGEAAAAAPILDRVGLARSTFAHPCRDLAQMLIAQDKSALVEPQYRACLALTPDDLRLRYGLAELLRERGDGEAAVLLLAPVLLAHPDNAEAHYEMGQALAEAGRFAEAADSFRKAIACDPEPAAFWANLGMMLKV
jgi:Flp pilus assembly protein TadD